MGALGDAFRRLMGGRGAEPSGGLVLAARHYAQVNQTWRRAEGFAEAGFEAPRPQAVAAVSHEQAAAARPDLANWDLPPGLASVVQAESADRHETPPPEAVEPAPREEPPARAIRNDGDGGRRVMNSQEMETLLQRLAD